MVKNKGNTEEGAERNRCGERRKEGLGVREAETQLMTQPGSLTSVTATLAERFCGQQTPLSA